MSVIYESDTFNYYVFEEGIKLSRVYEHSVEKGCFTMSAFKSSRSVDENMKVHAEFKKDLRLKELGFYELDGQYKYEDGTVSKELSVLVPFNRLAYKTFDDFATVGKNFGKKYEQETIIICYPKKGGIYLYYPERDEGLKIGDHVSFDIFEKTLNDVKSHKGLPEEEYNKIVASSDTTAFSRMRAGKHGKRSFKYEGVRVPSNHVQAYQFSRENILF